MRPEVKRLSIVLFRVALREHEGIVSLLTGVLPTPKPGGVDRPQRAALRSFTTAAVGARFTGREPRPALGDRHSLLLLLFQWAGNGLRLPRERRV